MGRKGKGALIARLHHLKAADINPARGSSDLCLCRGGVIRDCPNTLRYSNGLLRCDSQHVDVPIFLGTNISGELCIPHRRIQVGTFIYFQIIKKRFFIIRI